MSTAIEKECIICHNKFTVSQGRINARRRLGKEVLYCSKKCSWGHNTNEILKRFDTKEMIRLYVEEKRPCTYIAKISGICYTAIIKILRKNGVIIRTKSENLSYLNKCRKRTPEQNLAQAAKLRELYKNRISLKVKFICEYCGNIFYRLPGQINSVMNDKRRSKGHLKRIKCCSKPCSIKNQRRSSIKENNIDVSEVIRLYTENKESCPVIGKIVGVKGSFIRRLLKENNIPLRKTREALIEKMKKSGPQKFNTSIELKLAALLKSLNIDYEAQKVFGYWVFDFYLPNYDLFIECDGDYWHANPRKYSVSDLNGTQRRVVSIGKKKDNYIIENKRKLVRFWEYDINNNIDFVKSEIERLTCIDNLEIYGSSG